MSERTRKVCRIFAWLAFAVYLIMLCYYLFFAELTGRTGSEEYHYNLVLFKEIKRFIRYREILGTKAVLLNLAGNVVSFIPFGLFLPLLSHRCRRFGYVTMLSFDFSLMVELIQLISKVGSFDVDDLLLNTIGGALGYICFLLVDRFRNRHLRGKKTNET